MRIKEVSMNSNNLSVAFKPNKTKGSLFGLPKKPLDAAL